MVQIQSNLNFDIVLQLFQQPAHVRGLASILRVPHATLLRALRRLETAWIMDSRFVGKNRVFHLKRNLAALAMVYGIEQVKDGTKTRYFWRH